MPETVERHLTDDRDGRRLQHLRDVGADEGRTDQRAAILVDDRPGGPGVPGRVGGGAGDAAEVDVVVDAIVHAATARRPRSRYQVPASARAMVAATKVVPSPVMDAVMGRMFGTHRR